MEKYTVYCMCFCTCISTLIACNTAIYIYIPACDLKDAHVFETSANSAWPSVPCLACWLICTATLRCWTSLLPAVRASVGITEIMSGGPFAICFAEVWAIQEAQTHLSCILQMSGYVLDPVECCISIPRSGSCALGRGSGFPHGNYSGHKGVTDYVLQILGFPSRYIPQNSANQFWFAGSTGLVFGLLEGPNLKPCNYSNCRLVARCFLMFFV